MPIGWSKQAPNCQGHGRIPEPRPAAAFRVAEPALQVLLHAKHVLMWYYRSMATAALIKCLVSDNLTAALRQAILATFCPQGRLPNCRIPV